MFSCQQCDLMRREMGDGKKIYKNTVARELQGWSSRAESVCPSTLTSDLRPKNRSEIPTNGKPYVTTHAGTFRAMGCNTNEGKRHHQQETTIQNSQRTKMNTRTTTRQ